MDEKMSGMLSLDRGEVYIFKLKVGNYKPDFLPEPMTEVFHGPLGKILVNRDLLNPGKVLADKHEYPSSKDHPFGRVFRLTFTFEDC